MLTPLTIHADLADLENPVINFILRAVSDDDPDRIALVEIMVALNDDPLMAEAVSSLTNLASADTLGTLRGVRS